MVFAWEIHLPLLAYGVDADKQVGHRPGIGERQKVDMCLGDVPEYYPARCHD